jgi:sirohydrochlorin ferrochelatase
MTQTKIAAVLVGHGSLHSDSGLAMMQVAGLLREQGIAPIVEAGFLNFSQPTMAEAVATVVAQGATTVIIQPYFLIEGYYVRHDLRQAVRRLAATYPAVHFSMGAVLGDHDAMLKLACKRLTAVDSLPVAQPEASGLLFVAHGTPIEEANAPIIRLLQQARDRFGYRQAAVGYLDCNQPDIPAAFDQLVATGVTRLTVLPYFLHLGRHVRTDLPALFDQARQRHPQVEIQVAHHLDYDPLLAQVAGERIRAAVN